MDTRDEEVRSIFDAICKKCIDGDGAGGCRLSSDRSCALREHQNEIPAIIRSVKSDRIEPYVSALRAAICSDCKEQTADGTCRLRTDVDCGLDRYFPILVEAIERLEERDKRK